VVPCRSSFRQSWGEIPLGYADVGQPIHREPPVRIDLVLQRRRSKQELPAYPRVYQAECHSLTPAGEPAVHSHGLVDLQAEGVQGGAGVVAQLRLDAGEVATDVGAEQADRPAVAVASSGEPVLQEHALIGLQAVRVQGGAGFVVQLRPVTFDVAADVGASQLDRAVVRVAKDSCPRQVEHAARETFGVQG
jgi:hypothetical protein